MKMAVGTNHSRLNETGVQSLKGFSHRRDHLCNFDSNEIPFCASVFYSQ